MRNYDDETSGQTTGITKEELLDRGLGGMRRSLDALVATPGTKQAPVLNDDTPLRPETSYGGQKAMGEFLVADYSRKGFLDGRSLRLPTIVVRPGKPNKAASGFFSGIIREPLAGQEAVLPVAETVMHWHASPRAAVGFLLHAADLTRAQLEPTSAAAPEGALDPALNDDEFELAEAVPPAEEGDEN